MEAPATLNVTPLNAPHRDLDFINKLFDFSRLSSEYGFGPTISILVDKIVTPNSQILIQYLQTICIQSQREIRMMKCAQ